MIKCQKSQNQIKTDLTSRKAFMWAGSMMVVMMPTSLSLSALLFLIQSQPEFESVWPPLLSRAFLDMNSSSIWVRFGSSFKYKISMLCFQQVLLTSFASVGGTGGGGLDRTGLGLGFDWGVFATQGWWRTKR